MGGQIGWYVHSGQECLSIQLLSTTTEPRQTHKPCAISTHSPEWPAERRSAGRRYDTPLYSLTSVWSGYLSVLLPLSPPLPCGSISPLGHLRQSGGVDWCPFRLPDPSFPFSSTPIPRIHSLALQLSCSSSPSLINPLPSFPLQSLSLITHSNALSSLCLSLHPGFLYPSAVWSLTSRCLATLKDH